MIIPSLLAILPNLVVGADRVSAPVPLDPQGRQPCLVKAVTMFDGTWAVSDSAGRVWYSRDQGTHWDSVVASGSSRRGELFGAHVLASDDRSVWTFDSGWKEIEVPSACVTGQATNLTSGGIRSAWNSSTGKASYCRSRDGLRTWKSWFDVDIGLVPENDDGMFWNDKIWFSIPDSGYLRGTSDGTNWTRMALPQGFRYFDFGPRNLGESDLVIIGSETRTSERFVARSSSSGASWDVHPMSEIGWVVVSVAEHLFLSISYSEKDGRRYALSASGQGPWAFVDTGYIGLLNVGDVPYIATETSIYRFDPSGTGVANRAKNALFAIRRRQDIAVVELPDELEGCAWAVVAADGRILQTGRADAVRLELPLDRGISWLKIGDRAVALPPL